VAASSVRIREIQGSTMNIMDLQHRQPGPRAEQLLDRLQAAVAKEERVAWNETGHARLSVAQELEDARAIVAARLAELGHETDAREVIAAAQAEIEAERAAARAQVQREVGELAAELRSSADEKLETYVQRRRARSTAWRRRPGGTGSTKGLSKKVGSVRRV
jgi:hypothetical protein